MTEQTANEIDASLLRATSRIAVGFLLEKVQHGKLIKVPSLGVSLGKADLSSSNSDGFDPSNLTGTANPS
jgi:hypothetical protein